jgi:hypothetical protein
VSTRVERRRATRCVSLQEHGVTRARVRPGHEAELLDISAGGALIETEYRLLPGTIVELHLETEEGRLYTRGRVMRCTVAAVHASCVSYRGAVCFEGTVPWVPRRSTEYLILAGAG